MVRKAVGVMAVGARWAGSPGLHQFVSRMAVNTDKPALLVNICGKLVIFDAVWAEMLFFRRVWGAIFVVQIMLETTVIIKTDPVAIVAG